MPSQSPGRPIEGGRGWTRLLKRANLHWVLDARASATLGHNPTDKLRLAAFNAWVALSRLPGVPAPRPVKVGLAPDAHEVSSPTGASLPSCMTS
jgi:hypothetical protein